MIVRDAVSLAIYIDSEWFPIKAQSTYTASEAAGMIGLARSLQYLTTHHYTTV